MNKDLKHLIDVAEKKSIADIVLKNCKIINVFSHEILEGNLAIDSGIIIGMGNYSGNVEIDLNGKYVAPGLIDSHVHIETSMVPPPQFAGAVIPKGTTTVIIDPHEIANVCGIKGIEYMLKSSEKIPLTVFCMLPSCVPATNLENSGAILEAKDLNDLMKNPRVLGLGEVMNYPAVIQGDRKILDKIYLANKNDKMIDGHSPEMSKENLNSYIISGIKTDHECVTIDEMIEKLRRGMYISIREGSAAKNLKSLINGITKENERRCLFCTDDRHINDIIENGYINNNIKMAIQIGLDPITAIKMATINICECYGIKNLGAIAPGYLADLIIIDNLKDFNILEVMKNGVFVAKNKKPLFKSENIFAPEVNNTVNIKNICLEDFKIKLTTSKANIMRLIPHSLFTKKVVRQIDRDQDGYFKFNKTQDILKLAVIERHKATGNIGFALVENFSLKNGAIASTVANDSHNILVIGDNDKDMFLAVKEIEKTQGGVTIVSQGEVLKTLELPIAGLMSDKPVEEVNKILKDMLTIAYKNLNVNKEIEPFMTLSFLALPVIPEIKVTDMGLVDVTNFKFIDISV